MNALPFAAQLLVLMTALRVQVAKAAGFPYVLANWGVPVGLPPSGTIAANGALTLTAALPATYTGGIWLRFPAGAVSGDATGGIYWCVMSSPTAGVVYAGKIDVAAPFVPTIGSVAGGAAAGSGSAYTQTINADITLANVTLAGGAMGGSGHLVVEYEASYPNSANVKTLRAKVGTVEVSTQSGTTTTYCRRRGTLRNQGSMQANISNQWLDYAHTLATTRSNLDAATDQPVTLVARLVNAGEYVIFDGCFIEVRYAA